MICFEEYTHDQMHSAACQHYFCDSCWRGYICNAIGSGPACLDLRCPLPKCSAYVSAASVVLFLDRAGTVIRQGMPHAGCSSSLLGQ